MTTEDTTPDAAPATLQDISDRLTAIEGMIGDLAARRGKKRHGRHAHAHEGHGPGYGHHGHPHHGNAHRPRHCGHHDAR